MAPTNPFRPQRQPSVAPTGSAATTTAANTDALTGSGSAPAPLDAPLGTSAEGCWLPALTTRLLRTPDDFLRADVVTSALIADTLELVGATPPNTAATGDPDTPTGGGSPIDPSARLALQVGCWLLAEPQLAPGLSGRDGAQLQRSLTLFATLVRAMPLRSWFGDDPQRHEEVARALLRSLRLRPRGETHDFAEDGWAAVSTSLRQDALRRVALEQQRADELSRALATKRAQEAAAQYTNV